MALTDEDLGKIKHLFDDKFETNDKGFEAIDQRFDRVDQRLDHVDLRLDGIDGRLDGHDKKFDSIDAQFISINARFDRMDDQFTAVRGDIDDLAVSTARQFEVVIGDLSEVKEDVAIIKDIVKDHSYRITRLEHRMGPAA